MADEKVQLIDDDEIITLFDEDDNPMDFYEIAVVEYRDELYALLQPAEAIEGIAEDEVLIFKIGNAEEGEENEDEDYFYPVEDEAVQEAVFEEYLRATADDDACDGDCAGCASADECDDKK